MKTSLEDCCYPVLQQMMHNMDIETAAELCRRLKLSPVRSPELAKFLVGKVSAKRRNVYGVETSQWRLMSVKIARYFKCPPEKLFATH